MSSRIVKSRFSRSSGRHGRDRASRGASGVLPQIDVAAPEVDTPAEHPSKPFTLRLGFIRLNDRVTVIEVDEEVWGNKLYYVAALSEDPSVCIKALTIEEAVGNLIRHVVRSPTMRRHYLGDAPPIQGRRLRLTGLTLQ